MKEVIILKGPPASGKSTYAKKLVAKEGFKRVNKDDLRAMIDCSEWSKSNEKMILQIRDEIIRTSLSNGKSVVIDDTHIMDRGKHITKIKEIASSFKNVKITVDDSFCDVDFDTCVERDKARANSVGKDVIYKMFKQIEQDKKLNDGCVDHRNLVKYDENLKDCIICDLDGTLSMMNGRSPYDAKACLSDSLNEPVARTVKEQMEMGTTVFLFSGRSDEGRNETEQWLENHNIKYHCLKMRKSGDFRKDDKLKEEFYRELVEGKYNVKFVLDDRNIVVDKWRDLGLTCYQCWYGNF